MKHFENFLGRNTITTSKIHPQQRATLFESARARGALAGRAETLFAGIDFGTSGARLIVIDDQSSCKADIRTGYANKGQQQKVWESALFTLLQSLPENVKPRLASIAVAGTSATTLLVDSKSNDILVPPKLYAEAQAAHVVQRAKAMAPPDHTATASTSTLCKLLAWDSEQAWQRCAAEGHTPIITHQADWLASLLHGKRGVSDWNNCLKLGYDPGREEYPEWLTNQEFVGLLPTTVCAPGTPVATIDQQVVHSTGISEECVVCAGTTDSIAAFLAADVDKPGQAVTSLGSTLAIKMVSHTRVDDARYGVYSHRLGDSWLVGGASNTGGAVLRKYFSDDNLALLSGRMEPLAPTGLNYYPLISPGERFPINDPELQPQLAPRPDDDALFLQGIFEGIAAVEEQAYSLLSQLGATAVTEVHTAGGGAKNPIWTRIRQQRLGVPVYCSQNAEAAFGAALLAKHGHMLARPASILQFVA